MPGTFSVSKQTEMVKDIVALLLFVAAVSVSNHGATGNFSKSAIEGKCSLSLQNCLRAFRESGLMYSDIKIRGILGK